MSESRARGSWFRSEPAIVHAPSDFLHGSAAFATYWQELTGQVITPKAAREMINSGKLPAGRLGGRIIGSKTAIREHLEQCARGMQPAAALPADEHQPPAERVESNEAAELPPASTCVDCGEAFVFIRPPGRAGRPPVRCSICLGTGKRLNPKKARA
jgi:hypothetical protein